MPDSDWFALAVEISRLTRMESRNALIGKRLGACKAYNVALQCDSRNVYEREMKLEEWALFMTRSEPVGTRETVNLWAFICQDGRVLNT